MYTVLFCIIVFATLAMMVQHGIWNNLLSLMSILLGGAIAYGVHQPLVVMIDKETDGSYTYLLDFPILWFTFAISTALIKQIANLLSTTRVKFPDKVESFGGAGIGLVAGYVMACFTLSTFYTAPLSKKLMDGAYYHGETVAAYDKKFSEELPIMKPDFAWLGIAESMLDPNSLGNSTGFKAAIFMQQHSKHRAKFESMKVSVVNRSRAAL